jgi:hypothetical protein
VRGAGRPERRVHHGDSGSLVFTFTNYYVTDELRLRDPQRFIGLAAGVTAALVLAGSASYHLLFTFGALITLSGVALIIPIRAVR